MAHGGGQRGGHYLITLDRVEVRERALKAVGDGEAVGVAVGFRRGGVGAAAWGHREGCATQKLWLMMECNRCRCGRRRFADDCAIDSLRVAIIGHARHLQRRVEIVHRPRQVHRAELDRRSWGRVVVTDDDVRDLCVIVKRRRTAEDVTVHVAAHVGDKGELERVGVALVHAVVPAARLIVTHRDDRAVGRVDIDRLANADKRRRLKWQLDLLLLVARAERPHAQVDLVGGPVDARCVVLAPLHVDSTELLRIELLVMLGRELAHLASVRVDADEGGVHLFT